MMEANRAADVCDNPQSGLCREEDPHRIRVRTVREIVAFDDDEEHEGPPQGTMLQHLGGIQILAPRRQLCSRGPLRVRA